MTTTAWMTPSCKPTEHTLFKEYAQHIYSDILVRLEEDAESLLTEIGAANENEIIEKLGPYLIKLVAKENQNIIDKELLKRNDTQKFTLSCTYEGPAYLKKMMDTLMADKDLIKYKNVLLKSFSSITDFPKSVTVDTHYIIYDADLILGSRTVVDSHRFASFIDILFDNLKTVAKTEALSKLDNPSKDTEGAFKMIEASFDILKETSKSDTNMLISNLKTLFDDTQYASEISITVGDKTKPIQPSKVSSILDKQFKAVSLSIESENPFSHINFS